MKLAKLSVIIFLLIKSSLAQINEQPWIIVDTTFTVHTYLWHTASWRYTETDTFPQGAYVTFVAKVPNFFPRPPNSGIMYVGAAKLWTCWSVDTFSSIGSGKYLKLRSGQVDSVDMDLDTIPSLVFNWQVPDFNVNSCWNVWDSIPWPGHLVPYTTGDL